MQTKNIDYTLFFIIFSLIIFWMIMISSVSVYPSFKVTSLMAASQKLSEPNNYFYLIKNISHVIISFIVFAFIIKVPYKIYEKYAKYIFGWIILFLIIVLFIWVTYNWAKWWINIPFLPFSLQPAEFLKLIFIIYLAYFFKRKKSEIWDFTNWFLPFLAILSLIILLLMLQPDFGSILIIAPISIIMFFVAWWNMKHILFLFIFCSLFAFWIYWIWKYDQTNKTGKFIYIAERFDNFLSDNKTSIQNKTINFQTEQWLIAIWSWWFFWLWFWKSIQKFWYLPEVQWDFIFSVIWEELGFLWIFILVLLYLYIWYRWLYIALNTWDIFWKYVALWITSWIILQTFINIGVNLNIIPLTWVTLPFISYWWSSLLSLLIWAAILLNISRNIEDTKENILRFRNKRIHW